MNDIATPSRRRVLPRKTEAPPALDNLQQIQAYQQANAHVFGSVPSLTWFIRRNRAELIEAGALVQLAGRWLIYGPTFTSKALEIGRRAAANRGQGSK